MAELHEYLAVGPSNDRVNVPDKESGTQVFPLSTPFFPPKPDGRGRSLKDGWCW